MTIIFLLLAKSFKIEEKFQKCESWKNFIGKFWKDSVILKYLHNYKETMTTFFLMIENCENISETFGRISK